MLKNIILVLKEKNDFVSGQELARKFDVSRAYICKSVAKLKSMGYDITSLNNKGYLLNQDEHIFNEIEVLAGLKTEFIGRETFFFQEIDSTNIFAKKLAEKKATEGTLVFASHQTAGKGRLGRDWQSEKDKNIAVSFILTPETLPSQAIQITLLTGIAVCRAIKEFTGLDAKIKWPNDIIINGKKVSGILTEINAEMEKINYLIVGIGINANNTKFRKDLEKKATSIKIETGCDIDRSKFLQKLLFEIELIYKEYKKDVEFKKFILEYKNLCLNIGKQVKILYKNDEIFANVLDIDENGHLILIDSKGSKMSISSGEVSLRNANGEYI